MHQNPYSSPEVNPEDAGVHRPGFSVKRAATWGAVIGAIAGYLTCAVMAGKNMHMWGLSFERYEVLFGTCFGAIGALLGAALLSWASLFSAGCAAAMRSLYGKRR